MLLACVYYPPLKKLCLMITEIRLHQHVFSCAEIQYLQRHNVSIEIEVFKRKFPVSLLAIAVVGYSQVQVLRPAIDGIMMIS